MELKYSLMVKSFFSIIIYTPVKAGRDKRDISQKIQLLENRLDGVMINFNATLAQNTNIR